MANRPPRWGFALKAGDSYCMVAILMFQVEAMEEVVVVL